MDTVHKPVIAQSREELLIYAMIEDDASLADRVSRERGFLHVLDAPARWARGEIVVGTRRRK